MNTIECLSFNFSVSFLSNSGSNVVPPTQTMFFHKLVLMSISLCSIAFEINEVKPVSALKSES